MWRAPSGILAYSIPGPRPVFRPRPIPVLRRRRTEICHRPRTGSRKAAAFHVQRRFRLFAFRCEIRFRGCALDLLPRVAAPYRSRAGFLSRQCRRGRHHARVLQARGEGRRDRRNDGIRRLGLAALLRRISVEACPRTGAVCGQFRQTVQRPGLAARPPQASGRQLETSLLFVHIGTHKTGTSALQTAMRMAEVELLANGARYIRAGREGANAHHNLPWSIRGKKGVPLSVWENVRAELAASDSAINILSSEGFWFADAREIRKE